MSTSRKLAAILLGLVPSGAGSARETRLFWGDTLDDTSAGRRFTELVEALILSGGRGERGYHLIDC